MNSNVVEFLKTRKFWAQIIALLMTVLTYWLPKAIGVTIDSEMQNAMTLFLWVGASLVTWGDIRYDWINAEASKG